MKFQVSRICTGVLALVLVLAVLSGCGTSNNSNNAMVDQRTPAGTDPLINTPMTAATGTEAATALDPVGSGDPTAVPEVTPTLVPGTFRNPVYPRDFPDPDILTVGDTYFAYSTNSNGIHVQVIKSKDLMQWEALGDGLPALPEWAVQDFGWTWAPEVAVPANGKGYVMYFTTRFAISQGGTQCIGVATGDSPEGPFKPYGDGPLICPTGDGGAIDAASFIDEDGKPYLLWKNDGNSMGGISWIWIQPVSEDGLSLTGQATRLMKADQIWEGVLVEGPTLWKQDGKYYLFYSANDYASPEYAAGYAVADSVLGPYTKGTKPVLQSVIKAGVVGPGGQDITTDAQGQTWILFHGWDAVGERDLYLARLEWQDGVPVVTGLSRDPQPGPVTGQ